MTVGAARDRNDEDAERKQTFLGSPAEMREKFERRLTSGCK